MSVCVAATAVALTQAVPAGVQEFIRFHSYAFAYQQMQKAEDFHYSQTY